MDRPQWYADRGSSRFGGGIPPVRTWTFTAQLAVALIALFFLDLVLPISAWFGLDPSRLSNPLFAYQLATYALVHMKGSPWHLIVNVLVLYFFGRELEQYVGRRRFAWYCAAAAVAGSLSFLAVELLRPGPAPMLVGASAITTACLATYAILWPRREILLFFALPVQVWVVAALLIGLDVYYGAAYLFGGSGSGVAHFAHVGGAAVGVVYALRGDAIAGRVTRAVGRVRRRREESRRKQAQARREEVDRLLEKISREGISSLTRAERRFLEDASKQFRNRR